MKGVHGCCRAIACILKGVNTTFVAPHFNRRTMSGGIGSSSVMFTNANQAVSDAFSSIRIIHAYTLRQNVRAELGASSWCYGHQPCALGI